MFRGPKPSFLPGILAKLKPKNFFIRPSWILSQNASVRRKHQLYQASSYNKGRVHFNYHSRISISRNKHRSDTLKAIKARAKSYVRVPLRRPRKLQWSVKPASPRQKFSSTEYRARVAKSRLVIPITKASLFCSVPFSRLFLALSLSFLAALFSTSL